MPKQPDRDLEHYLARIAGQLRPMPADRRNVELDEVHQHLQDLTEQYQDAGMTGDQAIASALRQFGSPGRLGSQLLRAWCRENPKNLPGTIWSTVGWAWLVFVVSQWTYMMAFYLLHSAEQRYGAAYVYWSAIAWPFFVLGAGYIAGRLVPRYYLVAAAVIILLHVATMILLRLYHGGPAVPSIPFAILSVLAMVETVIGAHMGRTDRLRRHAQSPKRAVLA
jgi:hypothetical protein